MCGFAGFLELEHRTSTEGLQGVALRMAERMLARGPDADGAWADKEQGIAFGHRRLSIIDTSNAGAQPMASASGRWVIVYNGELYNTEEMRRCLGDQASAFRGHSDTEVLLETIDAIGVEAAATRANGIFAFAAWDRRDRKLWLVRDRLGVKPLYWGRTGATILFASQPKAFLGHPNFRPEIDGDALSAYLRYGYTPAPLSIYKGIRKLPGGWLAEISADGRVDERCWWDIGAIAEAGQAAPEPLDLDALSALINDAVARQMVSDVPLGAFLSGGVDSATVVAAMRAQENTPIRTFTVGFDEAGFDETQNARTVAQLLGTDHTELRLTANDLPELFAGALEGLDEPIADVSLIPTFAVSRLAREQVTVVLSGDGGDEMFAGYNHYDIATKAWNLARRFPGPVGHAMRGSIRALGPLLRTLPLGPPTAQYSADRLAKVAELLPEDDAISLYRRLVSVWPEPDQVSPRFARHGDATLASTQTPALALPGRFQCFDMLGYLPETILAKVDRASMATSLEARVPLLDHRIVEMAWRISPQDKRRYGVAKWPLREVLNRRLPQLTNQPKMGFGVPLGDWLRGPLRSWAEDALTGNNVQTGGLVDADVVGRYWREHLSGKRNWQHRLWSIIVLTHWQRQWLGS
jgi:asparagine synthase (glutamine-hydrolysing)